MGAFFQERTSTYLLFIVSLVGCKGGGSNSQTLGRQSSVLPQSQIPSLVGNFPYWCVINMVHCQACSVAQLVEHEIAHPSDISLIYSQGTYSTTNTKLYNFLTNLCTNCYSLFQLVQFITLGSSLQLNLD